MDNTELIKRIELLEEEINKLRNNATIPFDIGEAIKSRVKTDLGALESSSKTAASETQAVDEAGVLAYSVMKAPDGFMQTNINGTIYYVPYFS